ncbi:MAG: SRPBCC domain-containing protein [Pseudomonadales bacterium]|nr:SRPBCC domain-containing protein [Pseudomonadales bacterium]
MANHTVYSDVVEINAPIELVWDILLDFDRYPDWNPFTYRVETDLVIGNKVDLYVKLPKRGQRLQTEYVREVSPYQRLSWGMTMGAEFLLTALREQILNPISASCCTYQSTDAFAGMLTPVVKLLFQNSIKDGFNAMAYALKERAEYLYSCQKVA